MTPQKIEFKTARETYRAYLIEEINNLLAFIPNDTEIILVSSNSTCGIPTGDYTDVVNSMNGEGMGSVYNNTDLDTLAYDEKLEISKIVNIDGLEAVIDSIYNLAIFQD